MGVGELLPPPHPAPKARPAINSKLEVAIQRLRRGDAPMASKQPTTPPPNANQRNPGSDGNNRALEPVVKTVSSAVGLVVLTVTGLGIVQEILAVLEAGTSAQERVTVPVKPFTGVTVMVELPVAPGLAMVMLVGFEESTKSAPVPPPPPPPELTRLLAFGDPRPLARS